MRVEIANVSKRFGPIRANDDISMTVEPGSIHGLLGENGAGKSTLARILCGLTQRDKGSILLDGRPALLRSPRDALAAGIGMLHQEPLDFPPLTVLESFLVGRFGPLFLRRRAAEEALRALADRFGFSVDPEATVADLTLGERQQIELLRLLALDARLLLLDEPTTGISGAQRSALFAALKHLAAAGRSVILVSHKLADIEALCDRVTILRQGRVAAALEMPAPLDRLVELMFGRALTSEGAGAPSPDRAEPAEAPRSGDRSSRSERGAALADSSSGSDASPRRERAALLCSDLAFGDARLRLRLDRLRVREGEVLGLAGIEGSGQRLLLEVCAGLRRPRRGTIAVAGVDLAGRDHSAFVRAGVAYLPADRAREGLVAGLSIEEHVALRAPEKGFFLRRARMTQAAQAAIDALRIRGEPSTRVEQLSGGNQQRAQLSLLPPDLCLLLLEHPTRGLDIESSRWVWQELRARCRRGTAMVFSSSDLDEILRASDRIVVLCGGRISAPLDAAALDIDRLGRMIGGEIEVDA